MDGAPVGSTEHSDETEGNNMKNETEIRKRLEAIERTTAGFPKNTQAHAHWAEALRWVLNENAQTVIVRGDA